MFRLRRSPNTLPAKPRVGPSRPQAPPPAPDRSPTRGERRPQPAGHGTAPPPRAAPRKGLWLQRRERGPQERRRPGVQLAFQPSVTIMGPFGSPVQQGHEREAPDVVQAVERLPQLASDDLAEYVPAEGPELLVQLPEFLGLGRWRLETFRSGNDAPDATALVLEDRAAHPLRVRHEVGLFEVHEVE